MKLPAASEKVLVNLSDAGDVSVTSDFPTLLTGFPLSGTEMYALMMTWPATDIERPGAVWTHTLLLKAEEMGCVSADAVLRGFRRPRNSDTESYSRPTLLENRANAQRGRRSSDERVATILWALYEAPAKPVCVVLNDVPSESRQSLLLAILMQQWAELRATFTFAESPLWERTLGEKVFDLQFSSTSGAAAMSRRKGQGLRIIRGSPTSGPPKWASTAAAGLYDARFRAFIGEFGRSHGPDRLAFAALAEIWGEVVLAEPNRTHVDGVLFAVKKHFPRRSQESSLKEALFGGPRNNFIRSDDVAVLWTLSLNSAASCISSRALELSNRAASLWARNANQAKELVVAIAELDRPPNHLAREVLRGFGHAISPSDLADFLDQHEDGGELLLGAHPEALQSSEFWSSSRRASETALRHLSGSSTRPKFLPAILRSIVGNADPELASLVFDAFPQAIEICLDSAAATGGEIEIEWARRLRPEDFRRFLPSRLTQGLAVVLLGILDAETAARIPAAEWRAALEDDKGRLDLQDQRGLSVLFAAALKQSAAPADRLAARTYARLYKRAAERRLRNSDALAVLESVMVDAELGDVGKGIAIALAGAFRRRKTWRIRELTAIDDPDAFRALLRYDAKGHKKTSLAGQLVPALPDAAVEQWQLDVIQETLESYARRDDLLHLLGKLFEAVVKRI